MKSATRHETLDIFEVLAIIEAGMHLILLIAFIICVANYGLLRGTEHFVLGILKVIAFIGIFIFGLLLLGVLLSHHHHF